MRKLTCLIGLALVAVSLQTYAQVHQNLSIDIFAIPSSNIEKLVAQTSNTLKQHGMTTFYDKGMPVHTTLYLSEFSKNEIDKIKQIIHQISLRNRSIPLIANGLTVTKGNWVFINLTWSKALQRLADKVTLAVEPYRFPTPNLPDWVKKYPNKLAAFKRYGSPNVFQNFQPHLTLLAAERNPNLQLVKQQMLSKPPYAKGRIIGLGIGIADQWGQQKKILTEYMFTKH
ncbi:MAG: hypothetical protein CENE_03261 [Candidatus Celerinatantimonas neptuna]|nr:MAG: hypothetical protein CENE_03261 [Candidatus Celerinatantimonas neptuna]